MKTRNILFGIMYYFALLLIYTVCLYLSVWVLRSLGPKLVLQQIAAFIFVIAYVCLPGLIIILMRFSLLKCIVDPIAAAMAPLFVYGLFFFRHFEDYPIFSVAFSRTNQALHDGYTGLILMGGTFLIGLIASISPARRNGNNISYRILNKLTKRES